MSESVDNQRREVLVTGAAMATAALVACACGCSSQDNEAGSSKADSGASAAARPTGPAEIGNVADYPHDGIYDTFAKSDKVLVVRRGGQLYAMSAICTHRTCTVKSHGDDLRCPCHGSRFNAAGHVIKGPAAHDLPRYAISNANGKLTVDRSQPVPTNAPGLAV